MVKVQGVYFDMHFLGKQGIALMLVLSTVAIVSVLMVDLNYNGRVSYTMASNYKNSQASFYLAKSSVNVALLRLAIVNKLEDLSFGQIKIPNSVLEFIWSIPFVYPPSEEMFLLSGTEPSMGLKEILNKIQKEANISKLGYFTHQILGLDEKLNINIVVKKEDSILTFLEMMKNHYNNRIDKDEKFALKYPVEDYFEVINNLLDWIDEDDVSRNGGSEDSLYNDKEYKPRNYAIPSLDELHLVDGLNDELYNFISPLITVFSTGSINVNKISSEMWKAIDSRLNDDDIKLIFKKISEEGGFSNKQELITWIGENTIITSTSFNALNIPLSFDDKAYKIEAKGVSNRVISGMLCFVSKSYEESMGANTNLQNSNFNDSIDNADGTGAIKDYKPKIVFWELF